MKKVIEFLKKYWKATLFSLGLVALLISGVLAFHWEETAKTPFWWTFWPIYGVVALLSFIGLTRWFGSTKNKW